MVNRKRNRSGIIVVLCIIALMVIAASCQHDQVQNNLPVINTEQNQDISQPTIPDQTKEDVIEFEKMTKEICKLYRKSHKEQEISKVKRDFYKIYIEVVDAQIKYENRKREYNELMS